MPLNLGTLYATITADSSGLRRGVREAEGELEGLRRNSEGRLIDLSGRYVAEGERSGKGFGNGLKAVGPGLAAFASGAAAVFGSMAFKALAALPVVAQLATTLANVAPAAGVAATGIIAIGTAVAAFKIGMSGVGDAVKAALDPSNPKAYAAAVEKLSPSARAFVGVLHEMAPQLEGIKRAVQERLFAGLDTQLKSTATATLPVFYAGLSRASGALNAMGANVLTTARGLAKDGTLGSALTGATDGFAKLNKIPAQFVKGLVQIGAAAAPAFGQLTGAAAGLATKVSGALDKAFKSGAMSDAIDMAVSLLKELGGVAKNVFVIVKDIFGAASSTGGNLISTLKTITGEISKVTSSKGVQEGLSAIFTTIATLARTVGPLIAQALGALGPVFAALGPPAQVLIRALGDGLRPIIAALGPVLVAAAKAVGALAMALAPVLPIIGQLIGSLLPVLIPFINVLGTLFTAMAPVIQKLATTFQKALAPILADLPKIAQPLADIFTEFIVQLVPVLGDLVDALAPSLISVGKSFGKVLVAMAPVLVALAKLTAQILKQLTPMLPPLIKLIADVAKVFADQFAKKVTDILIPALKAIVKFLKGDFSGAWKDAKKAVAGVIRSILDDVLTLPQKLFEAGFSAARSFVSGLSAGSSGAGGAGIEGGAGTVAPSLGDDPQQKEAPRKPVLPPSSYGSGGGGGGKGDGKLVKDKEAAKVAKEMIYKFTEVVAKLPKGLEQLGASAVAKFVKGLSSIDISTIESTAASLATAVTNAFKNFAKTTTIDDDLIKQIASTNTKLEDLATQRQQIADQLKAATDFAASVQSGGQSFASALGLKFTDADGVTVAADAASIITGLEGKLNELEKYSGNISTLVAGGLSKTVVQELLKAGPEQSSALASAIVKGGDYAIWAINQIQDQIDTASRELGEKGANYLYDAGDQAGQGFLSGLEGQLATLEDTMADLATRLVETINAGIAKAQLAAQRALGIAPGQADFIKILSGNDGVATSQPGAKRITAPTAFHVENYHEAAGSSAYKTAEQLLFLTTARG